MRLLLSGLGVMAALVMLLVSGSMNFMFMQSLGKTPDEGFVLGSASAAADLIKALLPFWIAWAWSDRPRRVTFSFIGTVVFVFFTVFSLVSALGFAAGNRGAVVETREGVNAQFESVKKDLAATELRRAGLTKHRPASVIEQSLNSIKQDRRWSSTKQCINATASASRKYCEGYFAVRAELAASVEASRLSQNIERMKLESARLKRLGAGQDRDPQVSILSRLFGQDQGFVRNALIVVVALLVEVGSGLGLFLATGHSDAFRRTPKINAAAETVAAPASSGGSVPTSKTAPLARLGSGGSAQTGRDSVAVLMHEPTGAQVVGDIEDYCLERLQPAPHGGLSLPELFSDYQSWCATHGFSIGRQGEFASDFERIAEAVGIPKDGPQYVGVRLVEGRVAISG